jgi:Ca-activated chloride channel family protein
MSADTFNSDGDSRNLRASAPSAVHILGRICGAAVALFFCAALIIGTVRNPQFWITADQRGDALMRAGKYSEAAKTYTSPDRIGAAQYRNGDFEAAAKTFARVPGATGAYDQGNASLMHGKYDAAIVSYDRALGFHPGWKEAEENKSIAIARRDKLAGSGKHREEEQAQAYDPDKITFDQKGDDRKTPPTEMNEQQISNEELRATWLRQVSTTPADFLRAKFAYQASKAPTK